MNGQRMASLSPIDRREFMQVSAGSLILAAAGCGRSKDRAYARGNTLIAAVDQPNIDRLLAPDTVAEFLVYLPLVRIDEHGERQPCLATAWEHSADYLEWTYRLRPGVRWHDGRPVTVDDVKFTLDLHSRPDSPVYGLRTECTVHDESTFTVRGIRWARGTGADSYVSIVPKHLLKDLDYQKWYEWDFWLRPVGNGPYRYLRYQPGTMVELEANQEYYKGKPRIERVILKFTGGVGMTELQSGNVDAAYFLNPTQLSVIANDARFQTYFPKPDFSSLTVIVWQNEHPIFRDPDVRRALSLAINRRELLQVLQFPNRFLVDGVYTDRQLRRGEASELRYDPAEARRLLDEAGWRPRSRDGMRERNGQEFRFTALTMNSRWLSEAAVYMQGQFRSLGIHMEMQPLERATLQSRLKARAFEAAYCPQWILGAVESIPLQRFFGEQSPTGYRNPQLTRLLERLKTTADPEVVDQAHREMSDLLLRDQPVAILYCPARNVVVHQRVKGLSSPWRSDPLSCMDDLWLEEEPARR